MRVLARLRFLKMLELFCNLYFPIFVYLYTVVIVLIAKRLFFRDKLEQIIAATRMVVSHVPRIPRDVSSASTSSAMPDCLETLILD